MPVNDGRATMRTLDIGTKFPLKALVDDALNLELRVALSNLLDEDTVIEPSYIDPATGVENAAGCSRTARRCAPRRK